MTFRIKLQQQTRLAPDVFELAFTRPGDFKFRPGQHIRFHHKGLERDYTPVSLDREDFIRICVRRAETPGFSQILCDSDPAREFEISGPHGHFVSPSPPPSAPPLVFVGAGTGIAPFVAFARAGAKGHLLLQGARTPAELFYGDVVAQSCQTYVPCLSRGENDPSGPFFPGRVTDYLETRLPQGQYQFYVCGRRQMLLDTMDAIDDKFPDSRVFTERFS